MSRCRLLLLPLLAAVVAGPAEAGIFFHHRQKVDPVQRVNELIVTLKTDRNEHKRADAAAELRQYDTRTFPEIVPMLIDAALHDPSAGVRIDAVQSLSKIRPVSQEAGYALEQVLDHDTNLRVRLQARTALWQYHLSGYHGTKANEPPAAAGQGPALGTNEPPLAAPTNSIGSASPAPLPAAPQPAAAPAGTVMPPRLVPVPVTPAAQPMPAGPPVSPSAVPTEPPQLQPMPTGGPDLGSGPNF